MTVSLINLDLQELDSEDEQSLNLMVNNLKGQNTFASISFSDIMITLEIKSTMSKTATIRKKFLNYKSMTNIEINFKSRSTSITTEKQKNCE